VIAILITIMVLELRTPHGTTWASPHATPTQLSHYDARLCARARHVPAPRLMP
jgi:hypothetical protein